MKWGENEGNEGKWDGKWEEMMRNVAAIRFIRIKSSSWFVAKRQALYEDDWRCLKNQWIDDTQEIIGAVGRSPGYHSHCPPLIWSSMELSRFVAEVQTAVKSSAEARKAMMMQMNSRKVQNFGNLRMARRWSHIRSHINENRRSSERCAEMYQMLDLSHSYVYVYIYTYTYCLLLAVSSIFDDAHNETSNCIGLSAAIDCIHWETEELFCAFGKSSATCGLCSSTADRCRSFGNRWWSSVAGTVWYSWFWRFMFGICKMEHVL